jgi:hypothetical protein
MRGYGRHPNLSAAIRTLRSSRPRITSLEGLPELGGCAPSLGAASLLVADQLRTLLAEDRTDERRSCTHPSDTAPGRRPWSAWGLVAGFPRFFPVRIDDSHHTPYNEEIR